MPKRKADTTIKRKKTAATIRASEEEARVDSLPVRAGGALSVGTGRARTKGMIRGIVGTAGEDLIRNRDNKFVWVKKGEDLLSDKILIIQSIESGLPYKSFETICEQTPFSQAFWAETLGLSTKSLNRYKQTGRRFKPLQSEKIFELAEVSSMGKKVFDNDDDFELWLHTPSIALGQNKPIDLIKNSYGKELVLTELINIDQGIFV